MKNKVLVNKNKNTTAMVVIPNLYANKSGELAEFMNKPLPTIAAAITGAIMADRKDIMGAAGRIAQGVLQGRGLRQVAREINALVKSGKIPQDYAEKEKVFRTLSEMLDFINTETSDPDRLIAVQAMFYAIANDEDAGDEILDYQLFQIAKRLTANQLLILYKVYEAHVELLIKDDYVSATSWLKVIADKCGHGVVSLIEQEEEELIKSFLITGRRNSDKSGISSRNARLTDLGIAFCERVLDYKIVRKELKL